MRFTLDPFGDLEVPEGVTLSECRAGFARLVGTPPAAALAVDGVTLAEEQVAGVPPWVAGSRLREQPEGGERAGAAGDGGRRGPAGDGTTAASAPWHVAVVAGADAGALAAPGPDGRVVVGRGEGVRDGPGWLGLDDAAVSRRHVEVRAVGRGWSVRDEASANGTTRLRGGRLRRVRSARLRAGDRVRVGGTTLEVRLPPVLGPETSGAEASGAGATACGTALPDAGHGRPAGLPGNAGPAGPAHPDGPTGSVLGLLLPLAMSAVLAVVARSPIYLLFALTGPAAAGLPVLIRRVRRRRTRPWEPSLGPDPAATSVRLGGPAGGPPAWWTLAADGLAVTGEQAMGVGRALVGAALLAREVRLAVLHPPGHAQRWAWCRWLESRLGPAPWARVARTSDEAEVALRAEDPAPLLVLSDGCRGWRAVLDRWWLRDRTRRDAVLVVAERTTDVPAWCRWVLADGRLTGPGGTWVVAAPTAGPAWAEEHARAIAARDAGGTRRESAPDLPRRVGLTDLGLPDDVPGVLAQWRATGPSAAAADGPAGASEAALVRPRALSVPLGAGPGGHVVAVDLLTDGPHALVAGTTGSGKSELLQSLVLGLALRYPPTRVSMVLIDYKGGAGLGRCADLPHVVGQVSDLDPEQARRALEGLRTELRRREALLASAGVGDVTDLAGRTTRPLPRLLVVVDEFRAMSEDLPDFVPGLVRLAAQGRSLGLHLVLATQRPGGAVSPQMRANLALRVCLRVTEPADSTDVLEVPRAADLPQDRPGRAVLRAGTGPVVELQTAWAALGRSPAREPVRWAPTWRAFGTGDAMSPAEPIRDAAPDRVDRLVEMIAAAGGAAGIEPPEPVWSEPLPQVVRLRDLAAASRDAPGGSPVTIPDQAPLLLGLTDPPGAQGRDVATWEGRGLLLVAGRRGSGRSTAAATLAVSALDAGWDVHLATGEPASRRLTEDVADRPGFGTMVTAADPRRIARLLTLLAAGGHTRPQLLVVDDVAAVGRSLDAIPRGLGTELLERALRGPGPVVATGEPRDVTRWRPGAGHLLVLAVADTADDLLLGVPRALAGPRATPGRAVGVHGDTYEMCQVALPDGPGASTPRDGDEPLRLAPLPWLVTAWVGGDVGGVVAVGGGARRVVAGEGGGGGVVVGVGGDLAGPVAVDVTRGLLVVGPTATGRSTALAAVVGSLRSAGRRVAVVAGDGPLADAGPADEPWFARTAVATAELVRRCTGPGAPDVLVVDDLDVVARCDPALDEELAGWVLAAESGGPVRPLLIGSARTDRVAVAYRGACAALRGTACLLVLAPLEPGSQDVAGIDLSLAADPSRPRHPGRGVVVHRGRMVPVQVRCGRGISPPGG